MKKFLIFLLPILICSVAFAQLPATDTSTYRSKGEIGLLWKVTGNGLKKPSYLFGTMHVSQKLAFHLGEVWFNAIDSVEIVATEMNPETWLSDLLGSDLINASMGMARQFNYRGEDYLDKEKFEIGKNREELIVRVLREDPGLINSIMYRFSNYSGNFEEDSWLDMFIYQTGKKFGKEITGLETFDESMEASDKASQPDEDADKQSYKKMFGMADAREKMEAAYRAGNIDMLDSLNRKLSSKNSIKWLINFRNEQFLVHMDSIMKSKSLFTAVGAAHLPGEMGLINLLRNKGYTVAPVVMGERDAERRMQTDTLLVQVPFTRQHSNDSLISYETPTKMIELFSAGAHKSDVGTELINGAYYSVSRIKTYAGLLDDEPGKVFKILDSLLYDNIPGKISEQKNVKVQGYDAIDITTKLRKGHTMRFRIIVLPEEIVVMKVSAPEEKVNSFIGDNFLKSIQINPAAAQEWQRFTMPDKRLSILLPEKPVFYGATKLSSVMSKTELMARDEKSKTEYLAFLFQVPEPLYFEEDTFELSMVAKRFAEANDYTEKKSSFINYKGRKALKATYTLKDKRNADVIYVMQNLNYHIFAVYYSKSGSEVNKFFESVQFGLPQYPELFDVTDTIVNFTGKTAYKPKSNYMTKMMNMYGRYGNDSKTKKDEVYNETQTFSDREGVESITVELFRNSKYFKQKDEEHFKKLAKYYIRNYNDLEIKDETVKKIEGGLQMDFFLTDTGSSKLQKVRIVLKNSSKYTISAFIDPLLGESNFVKTFFDSFTPIDSLTGGNVFADKSEVYFSDLYGSDTTKARFAEENLWDVRFDKSVKNKMMKLAVSIPPLVKNPIQFKTVLLGKFGKMTDDDAIEFLKKQYESAGDTSDYQFGILNSLIRMKTEKGFQTAKELMLMETPLNSSDYSNDNVFSNIRDSLKLAVALFPDLLELLNFDEYKNQVYSLLADLVDSGMISPDLYKSKLNAISAAAKNELKRTLSNIEDENSSDYSGGYYSNWELYNYNSLLFPHYDQPNVKAHFDKMLTSDNKDLKLHVLELFLTKKKPVDQEVISTLTADDEYRIKVYDMLNEVNRLDLFPAAQKTQDLFALSLATTGYGTGKDSFELLEKRTVLVRGKKGTVYFYKRHAKEEEEEEDDDNDKPLIVGPMFDEAKMTTVNKLFTYSYYDYDRKEEEEKDITKKIDKILDNKLIELRRNYYFDEDLVDYNDEEYSSKYGGEY